MSIKTTRALVTLLSLKERWKKKGMPDYTLVGQTAVTQVADGLAMNEAIELQAGTGCFWFIRVLP